MVAGEGRGRVGGGGGPFHISTYVNEITTIGCARGQWHEVKWGRTEGGEARDTKGFSLSCSLSLGLECVQ